MITDLAVRGMWIASYTHWIDRWLITWTTLTKTWRQNLSVPETKAGLSSPWHVTLLNELLRTSELLLNVYCIQMQVIYQVWLPQINIHLYGNLRSKHTCLSLLLVLHSAKCEWQVPLRTDSRLHRCHVTTLRALGEAATFDMAMKVRKCNFRV